MEGMTSTQVPRNYWWSLLIRGIIALLFGIAAITWPGLTLIFFVYLFGVFTLIDGVAAVVIALQARRANADWGVMLIAGIVGIVVGLLVMFWPGITSLALFYVIAAWAFLTGAMSVFSAFSRYRAGQEWALLVSGVLSILLSSIMVAHPVASILALVWLIALFAIIYGIVLLVRAFQFRSLHSV